MSVVTLGEIVEIKGGGTPDKSVEAYWGGDIPWASVKDFKSTEISQTVDSITEKGVANSATNVIAPNTILVPTRMAVGKAAINTVAMAINQDLKALKPKSGVDLRYLLHALLAKSPELERQATGATVKGITLDVLRSLQIPLPPLNEQKRIAAILDQADELRRKRQRALDRLNQLGQAIFHEMFGDPIENPMGWRRTPLGNILAKIDSGWSPVCEDRPATTDEWGVLKLGAVTWGKFDYTQNKALPDGLEPRMNIEVKSGDLLFSRKNTRDLVAATAYVFETRGGLMMPDLVFRLVPKSDAEIDKIYLWRLLANDRKRKSIQQLAGGAAGSMPNISKKNLLSVEIEVPPIELQNAFVERFRSVMLLGDSMVAAAQRASDIFQAIQHRAFRGDL